MGYVSYTELRQNLKKHLDAVCRSRAPLVVTRQKGGSVVVLSLEEYEGASFDDALRAPLRMRELLRSSP
jgi:antitoxin YefM